MKPLSFRVFARFSALLLAGGCSLEASGTGFLSPLETAGPDANVTRLDADVSSIEAADAAEAPLPKVPDAGSSAPASYCRFRQPVSNLDVCRAYPSKVSEARRRADCDAAAGALTSLPCDAQAAAGACETTSSKEYVQAASCARAKEYCPKSRGSWTCLKDDPATLGNDRSQVVSCGTSSDACDLAGNVCCVAKYGKDDTSCVSGNACPKGATSIPCDGAEDCGSGQVCCIEVMIKTIFQDATAVGQCLPADECKFEWSLPSAGGGRLELRVCHVDGDCPQDQTCEASGDFSWWGACR